MATFKCFEEVEAWQRARLLTQEIYKVSNQNELFKDFGLREQLRRASFSIMSNIAEGLERDGTNEFVQFLSIAKGSAGEVKSLLFVALDQNYISKDTFDRLLPLADEISRMIGGLIVYLRQSAMKGHKYK